MEFSGIKHLPDNGLKILAVKNENTAGYLLSEEFLQYVKDNGVALIDENGKLLESQLPDLAKDVLVYDDMDSFPTTGADGVLYVARDTDEIYRWNGTEYVKVSADTSELESRVSTLEDRTDTVESDIITLKDATDSLGAEDIDQQRRISELEFDVMDLQSALDGISQVEFKRETKSGSFDVPTPDKGTLANSAEVLKVNGDTVKSKNLWHNIELKDYYVKDENGVVSNIRTDSKTTFNPNIQLLVGGTYDSTLANVYSITSVGRVSLPFTVSKSFTELLFKHNGSSQDLHIAYIKPHNINGNGSYVLSFDVVGYNPSVVGGLSIKNIQLEEGTVATDYQPYFEGLKDAEDIVVESVGANIFDGDVGNGYFGADGSVSTSSAQRYSIGYIPVSQGASIVFNTNLNTNGRVCFYDKNKAFISRSDLVANMDKHTEQIPSNVAYVRFHYDYREGVVVWVTESEAKPYEPYKHDSLSIPVSLKKGDEYDPSTGDVVETCGEIDLGSLNWTYITTDAGHENFQADLADSKPVTSNSEVADFVTPMYSCGSYNDVYFRTSDKVIAKRPNSLRIAVYDSRYTDAQTFKSAMAGVMLVYPLATPTSRHLTEPILNNLSVWEGGKVSVVSEGAQAEAEVSFRLNYNLDTRLQELETEVSQQNLRITNLEYENRIVKAVIKKKIAEETEMTGSVIQFPTSEGYPLADWGELKRLKSDSVVWNQHFDPSRINYGNVGKTYNGITMSYDSTSRKFTITGTADGNCDRSLYSLTAIGGHKYTILSFDRSVGGATSNVRCYCYGNNVFGGMYLNQFVRANASGNAYFYVYVKSGETVSINGLFLIVDLTAMGLDDVTSADDPRMAFVRQYAEAHPEYTAGTLLDSVYESGVSIGRNLWDETKNVVSGSSNGITWSNEGDGVLFKGTASAQVDYGTVRTSISEFGLKVGDTISISGASTNVSCAMYFYNENGSYITGVRDSGSGATSQIPSNCVFFGLSYRINNGVTVNEKIRMQLEKGSITPFTPYRPPVTLDLSFLNSVPDIGIEGTEIDFEKQTVRWNWKKVDLGDFNYDHSTSNGREFFSVHIDAKLPATYQVTPSLICPRYTAKPYNVTWGDGDMSTSSLTWFTLTLVNNAYTDSIAFKNAMRGVELVYELATPITKTFAELGITIPPSWDGGKPWIRVEAGGTFTVVSTGAPAEATVSFLTNLGGNA